jgi:hypothetical protein
MICTWLLIGVASITHHRMSKDLRKLFTMVPSIAMWASSIAFQIEQKKEIFVFCVRFKASFEAKEYDF